MIEFAGKLPSPQCEIFVGLIAGASNGVPPDATAYGARDARFFMNVAGRWDSAADDERGITWARAFFKASAPYASSGAYVNFMTEERAIGWLQPTDRTILGWSTSRNNTIPRTSFT